MISEENILKEEISLEEKEIIKDEVFEKLKTELIEQKRLLKRFYEFCSEYTNFEYDEMGINMEEADEILRKTNKIRDKFLNIIQANLLYIFEDVQTNTLSNMITFNLDTKEYQFKVILEVLEDSFSLEII